MDNQTTRVIRNTRAQSRKYQINGVMKNLLDERHFKNLTSIEKVQHLQKIMNYIWKERVYFRVHKKFMDCFQEKIIEYTNAIQDTIKFPPSEPTVIQFKKTLKFMSKNL